MRRLRIAFLTIALATAFAQSARAQKHPSIELGFNPDRLYQFSELDSVNLFNGNLVLQIPIGQAYPVNAFNYRLTLVYNAKVWDLEQWRGTSPSGDYMLALPNLRSNAGVGWRVSLGRLIEPGGGVSLYNHTNYWVYETPTGDEHAFAVANGDVFLTDDGSALRLTGTDTTRQVEFPNGEMHTFLYERDAWRLRKIRDRFGNELAVSGTWLDVNDPADGRETEWKLTDSLQRTHRITFIYRVNTYESFDWGMNVATIELATAATGGKSVYKFTYTDETGEEIDVAYGCGHSPPPPKTGQPPYSPIIRLPLLTKLTLPDETSLNFTYYTLRNDETCSQGALHTVTLPTRGKIAYEYQKFILPEAQAFCYPSRYGNTNPGVKTKSVWSTVPATGTAAVTEYKFTLGPKQAYDRAKALENCKSAFADSPDSPSSATPQDIHRWSRTTVLSPAVDGKRTRTDSYFYTWPNLPAGQDPNNPLLASVGTDRLIRFGQPITPAGPHDDTPAADGPEDKDVTKVSGGDTHFLSTRTFDVDAAGTVKLVKSSYLRYAYSPDEFPLLRQRPDAPLMLLSTLTRYDADSGCGQYGNVVCEVTTKNSDADGVHKYRVSTTTTNFPHDGGFSTKTKYRKWTLSEMAVKSDPWLLNIHSGTERTEGTQTAVADYCYARNGFLEAVRTRLDPTSIQATDLLTRFTSDAHGNVIREESYGGVDGRVSATSTCVTDPGVVPQYLTRNTYTSGVLTKSEACDPATSGAGCTPLLTRADIDVHVTGAPTAARDAAGVATTYAYDEAGRLKTVTAPGSVVTTYTYTPATANGYASVGEVVRDGAAGPTLTTSSYRFDGLGRTSRTTRSLPAQRSASVDTEYDAAGRKAHVSQPFETSAAFWTTTTYDLFGRPLTITSPDAKVTSFEYTGDRQVVRKVKVATSESGETEQSVTENYDVQRRLASVAELSNGAGTNAVTTAYDYDVGGRLVSVASGAQLRTFAYDLRGFLTSETHPESGKTTYSQYDARGHARVTSVGDTLLTMTYDAAERLTAIANGSDVLKRFTYAAANTGTTPSIDRRKGKLLSATRRNALAGGTVIEVTETYAYVENSTTNPAGQLSSKKLLVEEVRGTARATIQEFTQGYTYDKFQLPATFTMPACTGGGCGTGSALTAVTFGRDAGYLTSVANFASLTHHPSGMVHQVTHQPGPQQVVDTYSDDKGMARPQKIQFTTPSACAVPPRPTIQSTASVCPGTTGQAHVPSSGATFKWEIAGGALTSVDDQPAVTFQPHSGSTNVRLTLTLTNSCGSAVAVKDIAVSDRPAAPVVTAPARVCPNTGGHTASVQPVNGMTYSWSISAGGTLATSTGPSVTFAVGSSAVTLTVTATSTACGESTASASVATSEAPTAELLIVGVPRQQKGIEIVRGTGTVVDLEVRLGGAGPWEVHWSDGRVDYVAESPLLRPVSPDAYAIYEITDVRTGTCALAESVSPVYVTVIPPPPAWVRATTRADGKVSVTWAAVDGAAGYRIDRASLYGGPIENLMYVAAPEMSWADTSIIGGPRTYLYYVRAVDPEPMAGYEGPTSNRSRFDHATAAGSPLWAETLVSGITFVKPAEVHELARAVDAFRATFGLPPVFGSVATPVGPTATVLTDLVNAFNEARHAGGLAPFWYVTVSAPLREGSIRLEHIQQLREALQ